MKTDPVALVVPTEETPSTPGPWLRLGAGLVARNPLPAGTVVVGLGLVVSGLGSYIFLAIVSRALDPERYSSFAVLWLLIFLGAAGLFVPLEQEVGRAVSGRRARGLGGRPVVLRAAAAGGSVAVLVAIGSAIGAPALTRFFNGEGSLVVGFAVAMVAYCAVFLAKGTLAGEGRFSRYSGLLVVDAVVRVTACAALKIAGVHQPGAYGLAIGLPAAVSAAVAVARVPGLAPPGPPAAWAELTTKLGYLLAGSLVGQLLVNVGPLTVRVLAGAGEQSTPGRFFNGVIIARVPLFFFQAIQAALLPALAAQAAAGRFAEFRHGFLRLFGLVGAVAALAVLANLAIGPVVVGVLFGGGNTLTRVDLALLAAGSGVYMLALALAQALIALEGHALVVVGWLAGVLGFVVVLAAAASAGLFLRVELALVTASLGAAAVMGAMLLRRLAVHAPAAA